MRKRRRAHMLTHRLRKPKGDSQEIAAQLAPFEELYPEDSPAGRDAVAGDVAQENGVIVVGRQKSKLPGDIIETGNKKARLEPVVLVIVGIMLVFILFIAWQVSQMPATAN